MMNPENRRFFCTPRFWKNLFKVTVGLGLVFVVYRWAQQSDAGMSVKNDARPYPYVYPFHDKKESTGDEMRIARQFEVDTLPGLMHRGLIHKYQRYQSGTLLYVAGKVWRERSRFFKESLLKELLVYNKVHGYAVETRIVDYRSQRLYAQVLSDERKEFFD